MSKKLTLKEAKLAWANDQEIQWFSKESRKWNDIGAGTVFAVFDGRFKFRLKPLTTTTTKGKLK